jgi:hypothetical protein
MQVQFGHSRQNVDTTYSDRDTMGEAHASVMSLPILLFVLEPKSHLFQYIMLYLPDSHAPLLRTSRLPVSVGKFSRPCALRLPPRYPAFGPQLQINIMKSPNDFSDLCAPASSHFFVAYSLSSVKILLSRSLKTLEQGERHMIYYL